MPGILDNVKDKIRDLWRPRTEMGRKVKHRLLFGEEAPDERKRRRWR